MAAAVKPARIPTGDLKVDRAMDELRNRMSELVDIVNSPSVFPFNIVAGSFRPNNTGAPLDVRGTDFTVAYTSTGLWTVTLTTPTTFVKPPVSKWLGFQHEAPGGITLNFAVQNLEGNSSPKTIELMTVNNNTGVVIDIAASANRIISFGLVFAKAVA